MNANEILKKHEDANEANNPASCQTAVSGWVASEHNKPERNKYVLGHTPFCKYKCAVVFWNGVEWRSADEKSVVWNIDFWQELPKPPCH